MNVTLGQIRAFQAVADTLHFGRAATSLGISQPTVSKEIHRLERSIGVPLFTRSAGGSRLTAAGERLRPLASDVREALLVFEQAAATVGRETQHSLTIAASPSIVNWLLPELLRAVDDEQLGVTVLPLEVETGQVVEAVESGRADMGIGHHIGEPRRSITRQLGQDEMYVVLHRSWAGGEPGSVELRRLATLPLLLWPREHSPIYYDFLLGLCRERDLEPFVLTGTSRISGAWSYLLQDARAFSFAPKDFALREGKGDLVALPLDPPAFIPLEVVWSKNASRHVERILQILVETRREQPPGARGRPRSAQE